MRKLWLNEEIELLVKLYEEDGLSLSEINPIFNEKYCRTIESIGVKIGRLKLKHTKEQVTKIKSRLNKGELNGMFGKISPMSGLNSNNSDMIKNKSIKTSITRKKMFKDGLLCLSGKTNPMYGTIAWNNGLNKNTDERILNYGKKISEFRKKEWFEKSDEEKDKVILRLNEAMIQVRVPTRIENKIEDLLLTNNIKYIKNKRF